MDTIYLDHNATTRPADEVIDAMTEALRERWGNPSSLHRRGQAARQALELARESVSQLLGCADRELIFTSGGTEAANLAIQGSLLAQPGRTVVITNRTEHHTVREQAEALEQRGVAVIWLASDINGLVDPDELRELLTARGDEVAIVAVMWANNETGVIQPIASLGEICRAAGVRFFVDGTQWVGKGSVDLAQQPIDMLGFAAHKFHGPKGVGALFVRRGLKVEPMAIGGPQERERRGGTENIPGIIGLGVAAQLAREWLAGDGMGQCKMLRDRFERALCEHASDAVVNASGAPRLWNTTNIGFPGIESEAMLMMLSERGVCASAGAACASGSLDPSSVLGAMGVDPAVATGSIRFSIARDTTDGEIDAALPIVCEAYDTLRAFADADA